MRIFIDPERRRQWHVFTDRDSTGARRLVFEGEYRVYADAGRDVNVDDLLEDRLKELFRSSYREFWYDDVVWQVWWEDQKDLQTWTWFLSADGEKGVIRAQVMFPFLSAPELAYRLRGAEEVL
jgi:hypothetical protein